MDILAERLKYLREKHRLTQPEAGKIVDVQYKTYQKYEYGQAAPSISMLIEFAKYYKVSVGFLIGDCNEEISARSYLQTDTFSNRLQQLRKNIGYYQKDVALQMGIKPRSYQCYELGEHNPNIETLCKLAAFYGVSVDYLVGLDVEK